MRSELIHPLVVHFPLALLITGTVLRLLAYKFDRLLTCSWILLGIGAFGAWISVFFGEVAEEIVRPALCYPNILNKHQGFAYASASIYSIALLFDWVKNWMSLSPYRKWFTFAAALLFLCGMGFLITAGAFGASLVFEQGAAVMDECTRD